MLALIKREIRDVSVFYLVAGVGIVITLGTLVYKGIIGWGSSSAVGVPSAMYEVFAFSPFVLPLLAAALGASQMNSDKDKKISSFLATLATTRCQILSAKIITGVLWLVLIILPLAVTDVILLNIFPRAALPDAGFLVSMFVTIFLCGMACYSFGLLIGWRSGKVLAALGILLVTPALVSLMIIKGVGLHSIVIYILFISAAIVRVWQKFMSTSL